MTRIFIRKEDGWQFSHVTRETIRPGDHILVPNYAPAVVTRIIEPVRGNYIAFVSQK